MSRACGLAGFPLDEQAGNLLVCWVTLDGRMRRVLFKTPTPTLAL